MMTIKNQKGEVIAAKVKLANSFLTRLKGLMFSNDLPDCDGLLISPCNSIHTFFMNYSLDIIYMTKDFEVVKVIKNIKPWRMTRMYLKAFQVLEMKSGSLKIDLSQGEKLEAVCIN